MNSVENFSSFINDASTSNEIIIDDPSLFDNTCNTSIPIRKLSTDTVRNFRRTIYGLPFRTSTTPFPSPPRSPSLLFYQIYALDAFHQQIDDPTRASLDSLQTVTTTTTTTCQTKNRCVYDQSLCSSVNSTEIKQKHLCSSCYDYRCLCILILILLFILMTSFFLLITSNFGIRLSSCYCPNGYEKSVSSTSCICTDRNECLNGAGYHTCTGHNMQCINTIGSYICRCRAGFTRPDDQDSCVDINECDLYKPCNSSMSICINLPGRYYCQCLWNETSDEQCVPKNICTEQNHLCGPHSECILSSSNGYNCQCLPGHVKYENGQCTKVNECALMPSICERGRSCILTKDRFDCCTLNTTRNDTGECTECGLPVNRRQARIVNGDHSYRGQWPWMAVVGVYFRDDTDRWINITQKCAATLIANRYLLTAAHCLSNQLPTFDTMRLPNRYQSSLKDTYRVSFDVLNIEHDIDSIPNGKQTESNKQPRTFTLEHACIHPSFNPNTLLHDIAILKLKQPIVRSSVVDTICLSTKEQLPENGTKVWVAGWGSNGEYSSSLNILMHADLQILPPKLCPSIESKDYQICAGWADGKKDACRGDSGGPLMLYTNDRWYIIGIVSFGDGCSRVNSGGIYTRVSAYEEWILQIMSSSTIPLNCSSSFDYMQIVTDISLQTKQ